LLTMKASVPTENKVIYSWSHTHERQTEGYWGWICTRIFQVTSDLCGLGGRYASSPWWPASCFGPMVWRASRLQPSTIVVVMKQMNQENELQRGNDIEGSNREIKVTRIITQLQSVHLHPASCSLDTENAD